MVKNNPIVYACLICVLLFYTGLIKPAEKNSYCSLIPEENVTCITGVIQNSPVKLSSQKYYTVKLRVMSSKSDTGFISGSKGVISVFLPVPMVEALYPGKLYSSSKNTGSILCEKGAIVKFTGNLHKSKNNETVFYCSHGSMLYDNWIKSFTNILCYIRGISRLHFKRLMFTWGEAGGLLLALISGAREYTDMNTSEAFKKAGLSHIMALSGMHLSIFSGLTVLLGKKIKKKKFNIWGKPVSITIFVWFAGLSPSLTRAFICSLILIAEEIAGIRKSNQIVILCLSFLLQTIISPSDIYNAGFILSYGALAGILIFSNFFERLIIRCIPSYFASSLSASCGAQVITAPVSLKLFGIFCPFGIIASTIVSPLITIFIYSGLFLIAINLILPCLNDISGIFVNFQYTVIKRIVILFSRLPVIEIGD